MVKLFRLYFPLFFVLFAVINVRSYSQSPQRIVSLAPYITNMLYLLGIQDQLVGCTSYCEEAIKDNKSIVASAMEVNVEKVFLLKSDLVITTDLTKPSAIEALKIIGIKVYVFPTPKSYTEICSQLVEIARLTDNQAIAKTIIEKQRQRLTLIKKSIPKGKKPKVFFEIGAKPLFTVIPNTFMDDYITYAGGENIASDLKSGTLSRESVLMRNPDIIFIVTMGLAGTEEKTIWNSYQNISASKNGKVFIIDSDKACSPSVVSFVDIVEQFVKMMYK
jgi:ABC-type Fe3+-hydroxamate transport system substrate-binding protein